MGKKKGKRKPRELRQDTLLGGAGHFTSLVMMMAPPDRRAVIASCRDEAARINAETEAMLAGRRASDSAVREFRNAIFRDWRSS